MLGKLEERKKGMGKQNHFGDKDKRKKGEEERKEEKERKET